MDDGLDILQIEQQATKDPFKDLWLQSKKIGDIKAGDSTTDINVYVNSAKSMDEMSNNGLDRFISDTNKQGEISRCISRGVIVYNSSKVDLVWISESWDGIQSLLSWTHERLIRLYEDKVLKRKMNDDEYAGGIMVNSTSDDIFFRVDNVDDAYSTGLVAKIIANSPSQKIEGQFNVRGSEYILKPDKDEKLMLIHWTSGTETPIGEIDSKSASEGNIKNRIDELLAKSPN